MQEWFYHKLSQQPVPIYSSYDIRDSGFKVANVDGNIFPAGFNNICPTDKDYSIELFSKYLDGNYKPHVERIILVTEEHSNNPFYWENVVTIKSLLESADRQVRIGFPRKLPAPVEVASVSGFKLTVYSADPDSPDFKDFDPQLIISNNDFSDSFAEWASRVEVPLNPPRELGWYQRRKSRYFEFYNELAEECAKLCEMDPFLFTVKTRAFAGFALEDETSMQGLAAEVDKLISELRSDYLDRGIKDEPTVFIKNDAGTYGLAVVRVASGAEVLSWNYKSRKKMKAAKGGRDVQDVILQEGIPTRVQSDGATAEPVIYMIGSDLAGGFLRTHSEKSSTESLNSPGAVYKKLCVADLNVKLEASELENVYGWSARLGLLAIAREGTAMGVEFKGMTLRNPRGQG